MENEYISRNDFLGLSSEERPMQVVDGSTYYEVDTTNFYIFYKGTWYKQEWE